MYKTKNINIKIDLNETLKPDQEDSVVKDESIYTEEKSKLSQKAANLFVALQDYVDENDGDAFFNINFGSLDELGDVSENWRISYCDIDETFSPDKDDSVVEEGSSNSEVKPDVSQEAKNVKESLPFIVHAPSDGSFPTHTHGLTEVEMPEIVIDPRAFGAEGNCKRINLIYEYLNKLENTSKLKDVKEGKTIKLTMKDLTNDYDEEEGYIYCLRKVPIDFEAVKLAYLNDIEPEMWFMQLYVEGDDFSLTDEYYKAEEKPELSQEAENIFKALDEYVKKHNFNAFFHVGFGAFDSSNEVIDERYDNYGHDDVIIISMEAILEELKQQQETED